MLKRSGATGIFARVAMHAVRKLAYIHLCSHARIVAALSISAQDRWI